MHRPFPHLWYDKEAKEAAEFYTSIFPNSRVTHVQTLHDTPSGDADMVSFELAGQPFMAISAGPYFKFNPSISFHVHCKTAEEVDALFAKLSEGGQVLMPLGEYPWSKRYGWTTDRFGLSWQPMCTGDAPIAQVITPFLLFAGQKCGKAEEAMNFYTSLFPDSQITAMQRHGAGAEPEKEGTVMYGKFSLSGFEMGAMDSAQNHQFDFNEAISFMVQCETQEEIDALWGKLSAVPESEQCGWLKDTYGVSWQIAPTKMNEMMSSGTPAQIAAVTQAFLKMKKFDLAELERVYTAN